MQSAPTVAACVPSGEKAALKHYNYDKDTKGQLSQSINQRIEQSNRESNLRNDCDLQG